MRGYSKRTDASISFPERGSEKECIAETFQTCLFTVSGNYSIMIFTSLERNTLYDMIYTNTAPLVMAILSLYDHIQDAVAEWQKNNRIITKYLGSGDK